MADGFKLTYNPKVENARLVREGIKGTGPGTKIAQGGGAKTRPAVKGWNPFDWFKGKAKTAAPKAKTAVKAVTGAVKAAPAAVKGAAVGAAKVVAPIAAGAVIGEAYKNTNRAPAVSGRGAGRATFRDSNNNNRPNLQTPPPPANPNDDWADPVAGKGPENNQVGSEVDQSTWSKPPKPAAPAQPAEDTRVTPDGLVSYGKDLSSLNKFTSAFTGGYELTDIKSAFQSNDLEGAYQNGSNTISTDESKYTLPDGATPSNVGGKYTMGSGDISIENTGYKIDGKSVPGTVGGNPNDPQDGTSSKPDVAESIRTVRMRRKGPRDEGSFRGFQIDRNNEIAQQPQTEAPDPEKVAQQQRRNKIRSTFMDLDTPIIKASVAANAEASYGKDSDGNARFNYGGELVYAKEGMQQQAKNAAMMGKDPSQFLDIKIKEVQEKEKDK